MFTCQHCGSHQLNNRKTVLAPCAAWLSRKYKAAIQVGRRLVFSRQKEHILNLLLFSLFSFQLSKFKAADIIFAGLEILDGRRFYIDGKEAKHSTEQSGVKSFLKKRVNIPYFPCISLGLKSLPIIFIVTVEV